MPLVPSRVRLLAVLALAVAVVHPPTSDASVLHRTLTFTGSHAATMSWTIRNPVKITVDTPALSCEQSADTVHLGGRYAGVDIRSRTGALVLQAWTARGTGFSGTDQETSSCPTLVTSELQEEGPFAAGVTLPAGTYTVAFLTDRQSSIRFNDVSGLRRATTLHPTRPAPAASVVYEQRVGPVGSFTSHVRLRPGSYGVSMLDIRVPGPSSVNVSEGCFAQEESSCDPTQEDVGQSSGSVGGLTSWRLVRPGEYPPGAYVSTRHGVSTSPLAVMTFFTYFSRYR